ncbi:MAG: hypothetical protein IJM81_06450 [Prevotella sp.]|nr:hypothetical protein [Prevotella sp.]
MNLPDDFLHETRSAMGERLFGLLMDGMKAEPPVSIRVNPWKGTAPADGEQVPWCRWGYYLPSRPAFTFDPLLHAGCYYVQEASSMFTDHVIRHLSSLIPHPSSFTALDLCAAPGGKSTALLSALPEGSMLISNETVPKRARILSENLQKWMMPEGAPYVTSNAAGDFRKTRLLFDLILCDVPCSGEGMFRKNGRAVEEWSLAGVRRCQQLQRQIVADIWPCLRPGGVMVYSTCTFNVHENEENVAWIADELDAEVIETPVESAWNITGPLTGSHPVCRFIPGVARGEGLFMAVLRKKSLTPDVSSNRKVNTHLSLWRGGKALRVIPNDFLDAYKEVAKTSDYRADLSYEQAIAYLRGEAIVLPPETPRGLTIVGYQGHPLGLVKNIGSRANNLYPKEWRIKSTHVPI